MLLPPQFQTPASAALGAKVTAMPAPPKPPHVHQWLAVPDSKIHSRCAECGAVTLTEIVNPRPVLLGFDNPFDEKSIVDAFTQAVVPNFAPRTANEVVMKAHAAEARHRAMWAELGNAVAPMPTKPAPADPDGWLPNPGHQPVADRQKVQVRVDGIERPVDGAYAYNWGHPTLTHYRVVA